MCSESQELRQTLLQWEHTSNRDRTHVVSVIRHTVIVENLKVLVDIHPPLEEFLQVLEGNFHHVVVDAIVQPVSCVHWELVAHKVRRVLVELGTAVGRPHVLWYSHSVQVVATDGVARGGDPCDDEGFAAAVVVETFADDVLVFRPGAHVELPDLGYYIRQAVGGGFVQGVRLMLVGVELATFILNHIGVVLQDCLGVLKVHMHT